MMPKNNTLENTANIEETVDCRVSVLDIAELGYIHWFIGEHYWQRWTNWHPNCD